jgi:outer membrane protein TolC
LYKFTADHYRQGYLQKSDLLNVEVQTKSIETKLASARSEIQNHADNLSLLMGKDAGTVYLVDSLQTLPLPAAIPLPGNRPDFKAMEQAIASYNLMMKGTRMSALPRLNGFASYQLNDARMAGFHSGSYLAGLQLTWNIFQGNKVHSILNEQKLQQQKSSTELLQAKAKNHNELEAARRRLSDAAYQIAQTTASVKQAQEALDILQNRYRQGLSGITDVLLAQSQWSQQKLAYQQAVLMQNLAIVYINFLTAGK